MTEDHLKFDATVEFHRERERIGNKEGEVVGVARDIDLSVTIDFDGDLEQLAELADIPVFYVDAPSLGWHKKPFVPTEEIDR